VQVRGELHDHREVVLDDLVVRLLAFDPQLDLGETSRNVALF
jgi:hypothetical protein